MISATQISAVIPSGATSSTVTVVTPGGSATSSATLTVIQAPTITSFGPSPAAVGTFIDIYGTNFTDSMEVKIGPLALYDFISPTQISVYVHSGIDETFIEVTTSGGTATSSSQLEIDNSGGNTRV